MSHARFITADVFTNRRFGGNPLAVFPDATAIPEAFLRPVAQELNLSETVFVYPAASSDHTRRLRIFTPAEELPFAGHPTIGTAYVLAALGSIPLGAAETRIVFEEGIGAVPVVIRAGAEAGAPPSFVQLSVAQLPTVGPPPPGRAALAELLSLELSDLLGGSMSPQAVSCGLPFLFVPVKDRGAVARARVRLDHWDATLRSYWAPQVMVFSRDPEREGSDIRARVFVPGLSVPEDPATGSAAVALGGYLAARDTSGRPQLRYVVEQGFEMDRPSILEVEVDREGSAITAVRVGGECVLVSEGEMELG